MIAEAPTNNSEIHNDDELFRRFLPRKKAAVPLTAFTKPRTTDPDPEISVDLARLTTPEDCLAHGPANFRIGVLKVGEVRALGFEIRSAPEPNNPAHCLIIRSTNGG